MCQPNVKTPLPDRARGAKRNSLQGNRNMHGATGFPRRQRQPRKLHRSIDERYQNYEILKTALTAKARTPAEYDAAIKRAAQIAGV